jgi:hypothetical protein
LQIPQNKGFMGLMQGAPVFAGALLSSCIHYSDLGLTDTPRESA